MVVTWKLDRVGTRVPGDTMQSVLCGDLLHIGSSQAARAIRTAALGVDRSTSTGGLSTGWSSPALQEARWPRECSSWGVLPT